MRLELRYLEEPNEENFIFFYFIYSHMVILLSSVLLGFLSDNMLFGAIYYFVSLIATLFLSEILAKIQIKRIDKRR